MGARENFTGIDHRLFVALIALLKLGLTLGDEADNLYSGRPGVLNECPILDLDVQTCQMGACLGIDVIHIDIMDTAVSGFLRVEDVVVLVRLVPPLVLEAGVVELLPKSVEVLNVTKDQSATGNIIHPRKLHIRKPTQLVEDRPASLMALSNGNTGPARASP